MKQNSLKIFMETETWTEFKMLLKQVDALEDKHVHFVFWISKSLISPAPKGFKLTIN